MRRTRSVPPSGSVDRVVGAGQWFDGSRLIKEPVRLGIADGRIARVGGLELEESASEVEVFGGNAILCPGFIDSHSHSDFALADDPRAVAAVMQGITTQVVGQCGFSAAPLPADEPRASRALTMPDDPTALPTAEMPTWRSFADYREALQSLRPAINVAPFVGHNTLIRAAEHADPAEISKLAHQAIEEGARGVSTGLSYHPGRHTTDDDVSMLIAVAQHHQVPYHTHMRYAEEETLVTLKRTLDLLAGRCERATISHVFPRTRDQTTTVEALLLAIESRVPEFESLNFDMTVFDTGGTPWTHGLPKWAIPNSSARLDDLVTDPDWKRSLTAHLAQGTGGWATDWSNLRIAKVNTVRNRRVLGHTIGELAETEGIPPEQFAIELLIDDGHFWVSSQNKRWADVLQLLSSDWCIPMTDGFTVDPTRPDCVVALDRSWNTVRRFLKRVVPEAPMALETALRKLTSDAAVRLHLSDRGVISSGAFADLTVIDHEAMEELEGPDYSLRNRGIEAVMVNGIWVLDRGQTITDARPGAVL